MTPDMVRDEQLAARDQGDRYAHREDCTCSECARANAADEVTR